MGWLVTGGAGYIGSHVVARLRASGEHTIVVDNLSTGKREFVPDDVPFVEGDVLDKTLLEKTLRDFGATGVIHVAGYKFAGESVSLPLHAYEQNVTATATLLGAMQNTGVTNIVFSSSAAVYGTPDVELVTEQTPLHPESPYGESKLIGEWLLADQARATGLRHTSLRYFNVVGSGNPTIYDSSPHNLLPRVFAALTAGQVPRINGDDFATPDGTAVRDYIHVSDLADAHVAAAERLTAGERLETAYNLGSGSGTSVREIMLTLASVTRIPFEAEIGPRRAGDPARIVADGGLAARDLGWRMRHSLNDMVASAWAAHPSAEPGISESS